MEYLQFFDKEYTKINSLISDINYYIAHTKDSYSQIIETQKKILSIITSTPLSLSTLNLIIDNIKLVIQNSEHLLNSLSSLNKCFSTIQSGDNAQKI